MLSSTLASIHRYIAYKTPLLLPPAVTTNWEENVAKYFGEGECKIEKHCSNSKG